MMSNPVSSCRFIPGRSPSGSSSVVSNRPRSGLTVLELLITISIITVLIAIILPSVQLLRESARRMRCQNNLRQLTLAMHQHHDTFGRLPAGWTDVAAQPAASGWIPDLLPFLEQSNLRDCVRNEWPTLALSAPSASPGFIHTPDLLMCPSDLADASFRLYEESLHHHGPVLDPLSDVMLMELPHSNYVGIYGTIDPDAPSAANGDGVFIRNEHLSWRDLTNGLSHVAVAGERTARRLPSTWLGFHVRGEDGAGRVTGFLFHGPNHSLADECELDSRHSGGVNLAFADGHVSFISNSVDTGVYRRMAKRAD
jgi:prepilin-type processing-associated H-X9-DG protein